MADDTVTLRYTGPARRFRFPAAGVTVGQGETVAVNPDATVDIVPEDADGDDTEPVTTPVVDILTEDHAFERVAPDQYAVLDESIPDLEAALESGDYDAHLDALAHAERERENRTGALDAIHDRQAERDGGEP